MFCVAISQMKGWGTVTICRGNQHIRLIVVARTQYRYDVTGGNHYRVRRACERRDSHNPAEQLLLPNTVSALATTRGYDETEWIVSLVTQPKNLPRFFKLSQAIVAVRFVVSFDSIDCFFFRNLADCNGRRAVRQAFGTRS